MAKDACKNVTDQNWRSDSWGIFHENGTNKPKFDSKEVCEHAFHELSFPNEDIVACTLGGLPLLCDSTLNGADRRYLYDLGGERLAVFTSKDDERAGTALVLLH